MLGVLAIGDPHFKSDNGETTEELTSKLISYIDDNIKNIDIVAVLGDILHRHEKVDLHPFHRAIIFLRKIHETLNKYEDKYLYILVGNHDRSNNQDFMTDEHVFNPLKLWSNTIVSDKAIIHNPKQSFKVLLMPYVPPGRFKEGYESVINEEKLNSDIHLVLAHQEFHGAKMNLITSNEGDPWDSLKPLCVSGHIHDYQLLKSNLIYTGTPIQHGFADTEKKTVSYFKIFKDKGFEEERIDLKIKGKLMFRSDTRSFSHLELPFDKYFIKVKIRGTKREIKTFMSGKEFKESQNKGISFQFLEIPVIENLGDSNFEKQDVGIKFSERLEQYSRDLNSDLKDLISTLFKL